MIDQTLKAIADRRFFLIAGPCVVESADLCHEVAETIARLCADRHLPYIFKASYRKANRLSAGSFTGLGDDDALTILKQIRDQHNLPILTDIHETTEIREAASVADILQIPAFLCRQTDLVVQAAATGKWVNIKKGQFLAPEDMGKLAAKTNSDKIMLTERGTTFGYRNLVVDFRSLPIMRQTGHPVVYDATHSLQLPGGGERVRMLREARRIMGLFLLTIATAVCFQGLLHLPAVIGVLTGLSYLQFFGYYLKKTHPRIETHGIDEASLTQPLSYENQRPFDVFLRVAKAECDTLLFLCGVILSIGGLGYLGLLSLASNLMYEQWGPTLANVALGLACSVLENIPAMSAVLAMNPEMSQGQWLLATLTAGVGGSLLSIGSAAGIALMGQSNGRYTFFSHLHWTPAICLGYAASILLHLWLNAWLF